MNSKQKRLRYLISTGLLTLLMLMSVGMYVFTHANVVATFESLGYTSYLIYPLAVAKLMVITAAFFDQSKRQ